MSLSRVTGVKTCAIPIALVTDHWTTATITGPNARKVLAQVCDDIDLDQDALELRVVK